MSVVVAASYREKLSHSQASTLRGHDGEGASGNQGEFQVGLGPVRHVKPKRSEKGQRQGAGFSTPTTELEAETGSDLAFGDRLDPGRAV